MGSLWFNLFGLNRIMASWLQAAIGIGSALGSLLGGGAKNSAEGRRTDNDIINSANRNQIDLYGTQQNAQTQFAQMLQQALMSALQSEERGKLDRANFSLMSPNVRGRQALLGSLLQNLQPVSLSGLPSQVASRMPTFSGGLNAAAIGPLARQSGLLMQQQALRGLQGGDQIAPTNFMSGIVNPQQFTVQAPQLQQLKNPGLLERIGGAIGLGGSLLGAIGPHLQGRGRNPGDGVD